MKFSSLVLFLISVHQCFVDNNALVKWFDKGLYSNFPKIVSLDANNFKEIVSTNQSLWMINFYNSHCSACHKFSSIFKHLAINIYEWEDVIRLGAVDCSNPLSVTLCSYHNITRYPMLIYYRFSTEGALWNAMSIEKTTNLEKHLKNAVINLIKSYSSIDCSPFEDSVDDTFAEVSEPLVAIAENKSSTLGCEIVIDFRNIKNLKIKLMNDDQVKPTIIVKANNLNKTEFAVDHMDKQIIYKTIQEIIHQQSGELIELPKLPDYSELTTVKNNVDNKNETYHLKRFSRKMVYQRDLDKALWHAIFVEISQHKLIKGDSMISLKDFLQLLVNYYPHNANKKNFLQCILNNVETFIEIEAVVFNEVAQKCSNGFNDAVFNPESEWVMCKPPNEIINVTMSGFTIGGGYPCGLWLIFHSLTVNFYANPVNGTTPQSVLRILTNYVDHFFSCVKCSSHFISMAEAINYSSINSSDDAVIWFWEAHNTVTKQLVEDPVSDRFRLKREFPDETECGHCRVNGIWDRESVIKFLFSMYSKHNVVQT